MKMPGRELAIVLVGLVLLAAVWVFVFMSARRGWRPAGGEPKPASETEPSANEQPAPDAEPAADAEPEPAEAHPGDTGVPDGPDAGPEAEVPSSEEAGQAETPDEQPTGLQQADLPAGDPEGRPAE